MACQRWGWVCDVLKTLDHLFGIHLSLLWPEALSAPEEEVLKVLCCLLT